MAKSKLEQFKALSPLAAAIAFSATLPQQALAATHLIKSQEDLDDAIVDIIDADNGTSHTITFDSSLSGEHLTLNQIALYDNDLVIDGVGAKDLELGVLERSNTYGVRLWGAGESTSTLTIKNVNIVECDELVRLPMKGAVESLNVSVASGVCLYEALRQRGG